jgi:hypothetical protein
MRALFVLVGLTAAASVRQVPANAARLGFDADELLRPLQAAAATCDRTVLAVTTDWTAYCAD